MLLAFLANVTALTAVTDSYPMLSPDGRALVFHSNRSGRRAIWIAKVDGSEPRILFDHPELGSDPGTAVWSPDGKWIVFGMRPADATLESESDVYVMAADGTGLKRLTAAPGDDSHPHWSADGKRIFFNSARATPDLKAEWSKQWIDIYSMAADGNNVRRHTDCRNVCTYPTPSPDGRHVLHRRVLDRAARDWEQQPAERDSEVYVTPLDGSAPRNLSNSSAYDGWPTWTPDGRWVIFASNRDGAVSTGQLFRIRPDGTGLQRITTEPYSHTQPSVSADGKAIYVYRSTEAGGTEIGQVARVDLEPAQ
jgi:TolB protein